MNHLVIDYAVLSCYRKMGLTPYVNWQKVVQTLVIGGLLVAVLRWC